MNANRLVQLYFGLTLYGLAIALMVHSDLGLNPWDVLHQGLAGQTNASIGTIMIGVGLVVMLLWIPLRQWPGIGTVSNVFVIGLASDFFIGLLPHPQMLAIRLAALGSGIALCAFATALYIGAGFGPGPRDGLMTGLAKYTGWSLRRVRTAIEILALTAGWLLGGTAGIGTVLFALAIGPLVQFFVMTLSSERLPALRQGEPDCQSC